MADDDAELVSTFARPLDRLKGFQCRLARSEGYVRFGIDGRNGSCTAPIAAVASAIREAAKHHLTTSPAPPDHGESAATRTPGTHEVCDVCERTVWCGGDPARNVHCGRGDCPIPKNTGDSALRRISAAPENAGRGIDPVEMSPVATRAAGAGEIDEMRAALRRLAIVKHQRAAEGGTFVDNGYSCRLCKAACDRGAELVHAPDCLIRPVEAGKE